MAIGTNGKPPVPDEERLQQRIQALVTSRERAQIEDLARAAGCTSLSEYARLCLLAAVQGQLSVGAGKGRAPVGVAS